MKRLCLSVAILCTLSIACKKANPGAGSGSTSKALEVVYQDSTYQFTGVAISHDGRLFTCYPRWSTTYKNAVAEVTHGNPGTPYPNQFMNSWNPGDSGLSKWVCAQSLSIDAGNNLWVVDPASPYEEGVYQNSQKLVEISLSSNSVMHTYPLAGVSDDQSYLMNVAVDNTNNIAYVTNSSEGGILVVNLNTGWSRQVLQGSGSVISDQSYILTIDGQQINKFGAPFYANSDGLALTPDDSYLYYKPLSDHNLYRIPTSDLRDTTLSPTVLSARVENMGTYVTTNGMIFDQAGNLYMGDIEQHRIVKLDKSGKLSTIVQDSRLIWPDSYSISSDGYLYISCSQVNLGADFNGGTSKRTTPYTIFRIKLP